MTRPLTIARSDRGPRLPAAQPAAWLTCAFISLTLCFDQANAAIALSEVKLWRRDPGLQQMAKRLNPMNKPPGDGALGLNIKFPERVLVEHQLDGWNWIRAGIALGNGYIVDRGIMAFEWAFARMRDDGAFGDSKTIEVSHFLGLYARSILLLREAGMNERFKRLERLMPRLEVSLRSPRSLLGERRWDQAERKTWNTPQRIQAAAAAFWIGRLLANPNLGKTAEIWLDEALARQLPNGFFPSGLPENSRVGIKSQLAALEDLQGLALSDGRLSAKLMEPIKRGFRLVESATRDVKAAQSPVTYTAYLAWSRAVATTKNQKRR